ncbi:MAG: hypothetical protein LM601_09345 [Candidatus Verstraetearchaeota archaeon]|nr:hypothetical protein [Candidatus Verstraetearchaeota archaeon]
MCKIADRSLPYSPSISILIGFSSPQICLMPERYDQVIINYDGDEGLLRYKYLM